jgi:glycerophosphoryl diester phosphodiesterase
VTAGCPGNSKGAVEVGDIKAIRLAVYWLRPGVSTLLALCAFSAVVSPMVATPKVSIAHRGASAYAPEHTRAAYELAIAQRADYVEQDLAVTSDGALICLHDDSLERTTDVEEIFPDRATTDPLTGARRWMAHDFTLAEIKRLDAGRWFDAKFAGERVLTWQEAVDVVGGRAGLYPELKSPALYRARRVDMVAMVVAELRRTGLDRATTAARPPIILQSFDAEALRALTTALPALQRVFLMETVGADRWLSKDGLREVAMFATGIGPNKAILDGHPEIVEAAHAAGLSVTPFTFRSRATGRFPNVRAEMDYFLFKLGVDAVFTDNPDQFPR